MSQYRWCDFKQAEWTQWALKDCLCHQWQKVSETLIKPQEMDHNPANISIIKNNVYLGLKQLKTQNVQIHKS